MLGVPSTLRELRVVWEEHQESRISRNIDKAILNVSTSLFDVCVRVNGDRTKLGDPR